MRRSVRKVLAEKMELQVPESTRMLTTFEVANFLRLSRDALSDWRKNGVGPPFLKLSRRTVRYPRRAFERYMRQHLQDRTLLSGNKPAELALQENRSLLSS